MRALHHARFACAAALALVASPATAQTTDNGASAEVAGNASVGATTPKWRTSKAAEADEADNDPRVLQAQNTLIGTTGLLRTVSADSGAAGTFRMNVVGTYYKGSDFLCGTCALPGNPRPIPTPGTDKLTQFGTRLLLSATPVDFFEAYAALRYQSTADSKGQPHAIEIVGDTTLGVKLFTPPGPNSILSFGGALDMLLISSPGGVSFDTASAGIRALGTADFTRRTNKNDRVPLRLHLNLGYEFDNSGILADDVEKSRNAAPRVAEQRISRIERFGHDINRVDHFGTALGVEGVFSWVRPFGEWSIDVPANRQSHHCGNSINQLTGSGSRNLGDGCLSSGGFAETPSRVTLGARFYPWASEWMRGLGLLLAADIGTGATSSFIEEVAPERPWAIHVGFGWAADTAPRIAPKKVVEKIVEVPAAPLPEHHIEGTVRVAGKEDPIANAIVRYENKSITGMVTSEDGKFRTANLDPGEYRFTVTAEGFKDGDCTAVIPADKPAERPGMKPAPVPAPAPAKKGEAPATPPASTPSGTAGGSPNVMVTCELEPLPRAATITGTLRNADTTLFIEAGTVTITDPLGRQLALKTDAEGTFRFGNVPAGKSKLIAEADGYLSAATELTLEPRHDVSIQLSIHERPKAPNVVVTKNEIKLKKEVHFLHGSAEILPDSTAILEEVADVLRQKINITNVEVQGHTDDSGTPEINLRLSADRANAVRKLLVDNGVDGGRLTARGYGQEKPLAPNTTAKNKAKNRRVQLVITP
jgi:outer membrane protein OmpA-like peptidoglycan-associated protein